MHTVTHMQTYIHQHGKHKSGTYINIVLNTKAESLEQRFTFIHHPDAETFLVNVAHIIARLRFVQVSRPLRLDEIRLLLIVVWFPLS